MSSHGLSSASTDSAAAEETAPLLLPGGAPSNFTLASSSKRGVGSSNNINSYDTNTTNTAQNTGTTLDSTSPPNRALQRSLGLSIFNGSGRWFPAAWDVRDVLVHPNSEHNKNRNMQQHNNFYYSSGRVPTTMRVRHYRGFRRRLFLVLTEPDTSILSAIFFVVLVLAIMVMNLLMMAQTMEAFQFTPKDCVYCGGDVEYAYDDDNTIDNSSDQANCVCPPSPYPWTDKLLQYLIYFFSAEWVLRVLCYTPPPHQRHESWIGRLSQFIDYLFSWTLILDFWATFPYYMEFLGNSNGLMSLRLLRLFRVFQLFRLGSYNATFTTLLTVLNQAMQHLKLMVMILLFGAALFGSLIFWLEKGTWQYWEASKQYEFIRLNEHGEPEVSPFTSIPSTFYWFMVTATTVGYGDVYPTSQAGRWVGVLAMLTGVLVIAFPVGVFSDLWSKELEKAGALKDLETYNDSDENSGDDGDEFYESSDGGTANRAMAAAAATPPSSGNSPAVSTRIRPDQVTGNYRADLDDFRDEPISIDATSNNAVVGDTVIPATLNPYSSHHPVTGSAARNWNYGYQHAPHLMSNHTVRPSELVILEKSDLAEILLQLQQIQQSQTQIRGILRKYKLIKSSGMVNDDDVGENDGGGI